MANNPPNPGIQEAISVPNVIQESTSDWQEHTAGDGRRYFYNKRTNMSSWEKPLELMTPLEKADASTVWKEFTNAEGKKFYYNKETKQSEWTIPNELKLARMKVNKEASRRSHSPVSPIVNGAPSVVANHISLSPETNIEISKSNGVANANLDEASMQDSETVAHSGRERRQMQQRVHLPSDSARHQWLQFPRTLPSILLTEYNARLSKYANKQIEIPHSLDWELATEVGLTSKIKRLLTQEFGDGHRVVHFTCHAWRNLFQIREPVYRELVLEFYSTVEFNEICTDIDDWSVFSFRLGGMYRKCSLRDLSWRLGLYTKLETNSIHFRDFLTYAHQSQPDQFRPAEFWATIANGAYDASQAVESRIRSPVHRLVHRLIATSLNHRKGSKKVPMLDLFYLWCILTPGVLLNIPHAVALYLSRGVNMGSSPICGGHFITRLARSYGLLTEPNERTLLRYEPKNMGLTVLVAMRILQWTDEGGARIMDIDATEPQEVPMADQDQPEQRRRQRRRIHAPARVDDEPVLDLRYLSGRIDELDRTVAVLALYQDDLRQYQFRLQGQFQWMGTAITSLLAHHGITVPSPFPPPPPLYPSWGGSRFTTHPPPGDNGAGTSGTQPDSDDEL